jgi:hypothetical protein
MVRQCVGREAEVEELYNAVVNGRPVFRDGRWGAATLEVCLAMIESGERRQEVFFWCRVRNRKSDDKGSRRQDSGSVL